MFAKISGISLAGLVSVKRIDVPRRVSDCRGVTLTTWGHLLVNLKNYAGGGVKNP